MNECPCCKEMKMDEWYFIIIGLFAGLLIGLFAGITIGQIVSTAW